MRYLYIACCVAFLLGLQTIGACRSVRPEPFQFVASGTNEKISEAIRADAGSATRDIETFFGVNFPHGFQVLVLPSRAAFDASLPVEWGLTPTQCWMVASGVAERLWILAPDAWPKEACDHDASDARHIRNLVAHELVHVFHGQANPSGDFRAVEGIDWFVEGLATYVSGQLDEPHLLSAEKALETGNGPKRLADAWKGKYRYGVSGSLVRFLDHEIGRARLYGLLRATNQRDLLSLAGMSESELLDRWRASVHAAQPAATNDRTR